MPSLSISSTINCCSSRDPPSPDGVAPRPSSSPSKLSKQSPKKNVIDPIPTWSSSEPSELRAIFEDDNEDIVTDADEQHDKVHENPKLKSILEGGQVDSHMNPKKSTSSLNLKAVTKKLKKHLSKESGLEKRQSRSSVGTSDEEVERRAELRRIRQKRIQDELSNEGIYDEDAKSLSSFADLNTSTGIKTRTSWVPGSPLPLPSLKPPSLRMPALLLPKLAPLEHRDDGHINRSTTTLNTQLDITESSQTMVSSSGGISRRYSSPVLADFELSFADPRVYLPTRKRSSVVAMPAAPILQPKRLPSVTEANKSSWRLSFSSEKRGEQLRKLSKGHTVYTSSSADHLGIVTSLPMRWLHSQGLRSPSQAVTSTEDSINMECLASHFESCSSIHDFGGVDGPEYSSKTVHLHEMGISKLLASKGLHSSSSSPQLSSWGSHRHGPSSGSGSGSGPSQSIQKGRERYLRNTSDSTTLSERMPPSWGKIVQDGASSFYPSVGNSIQPSPQSSRFNLMSMIAGSKSKSDFEGNKDVPSKSSLPGAVIVQNVNVSTTSLGVTPSPYARGSLMDDSSFLASETESFREREAELNFIQTRFGNAANSAPSTPKSSRFREEFELIEAEKEVSTARKSSAFARLARLAMKSYDGPAGMEDLLSVPVPNFAPRSQKPDGGPGPLSPMSPLSDDSEAGVIWGKAVKKTAEEKANEVGRNLQIPGKKGSQSGRKHSSEPRKSVFRNLSFSNKGKGSVPSDKESAAAEYQQRFQERLAVKELVLDDWEAEMEASAQRAKAKSRNIVKKRTGPDKRFPMSWARYPSHNRLERSSSAGKPDKVESHDFAMRTNEQGNQIFHKCVEIGELHLHEDHPEWEIYRSQEMGFRERVGDRISQRVYKIETSGGGSKAFEFQTGGRRGSMMVASKLEYPELEILPVQSAMTEEQLAQSVSEEHMNEVREERKKITRMMIKYREVDGNVEYDPSMGDGHSLACETEVGQDIKLKTEASGYAKLGSGDETEVEDLDISIADPKFYQDCIIHPAVDDTNGDIFQAVLPKPPKRDKFRTWHGRDWDGFKDEMRRKRNTSLGTLALRKSTDDYHSELKKMEKLEREKVLVSAELAWGKHHCE